MAPVRFRPLAGLLAAALLAFSGSGGAAERSSLDGGPVLGRSLDAGPSAALLPERLALSAITWRGGPITTSTGETVDVRVSDALPVETVTPETWAEFIVKLTHGPEIASLTTYIAPLNEVQQLCGARALGCYSPNRMVAMADTVGETDTEEVVRHEYGHHVAFTRANPPWRAIDWGPKRWATAASVCTRVARGEAFPGDQRANYALNPGEAWAETYRLMDEQRAGITTGSWPIIAPSFYPDPAALQAAELDVLQPWVSNTVTSVSRPFGKNAKRASSIPLTTALDGELRITATLPRGGQQDVALVSQNGRTVLGRAQRIGPRAKRLTATVCGQRPLAVRVTPKGAPGRVSMSISAP